MIVEQFTTQSKSKHRFLRQMNFLNSPINAKFHLIFRYLFNRIVFLLINIGIDTDNEVVEIC